MKPPPLESVFLTHGPLPDSRDFDRVLVVGRGSLAEDAAKLLTVEGYEVLSAAPHRDMGSPYPILEEVHGFVGDYQVVLRTGSQRSIERVGTVVAADVARLLPKFQEYGLSASERVLALSHFEALIVEDRPLPPARGAWFHAAFLCGLEGGSDPASFSRVFDAIERLRSKKQVQTYVFTRNVKVAAHGLERRYQEARDTGTLFFKFDGPGPDFEVGPDGPVLVFTDPLLGLEMELAADILVVDEQYYPPALEQLLDTIPSAAAMKPFLQPESTRFPGVTTPKAGIFAVGPARGNFTAEAAAGDLCALPTYMRNDVRGQLADRMAGPPEIDQAKCTICLTCVRLCPHGAMSFRKRAEADPLSCMRCGICAVECPEKAIRLAPSQGMPSVDEYLSARVSTTVDSRIVAFLCSRSAAQALKMIGQSLLANVDPIVVPCAGSVDVEHILTALQVGAAGVLVAGCHPGNCASIYGTVLAGERAARATHMLGEAGLDPNRVLFTTVAGNAPIDLVRAVERLHESTEAQRS